MGTHNSYHIAPPSSVITFLTSPIVTGLLGSDADMVPGAWEVTMQPLGQQLGNYGVQRLPARTSHALLGPVLHQCIPQMCHGAEHAYHLSHLALEPGNTVGLLRHGNLHDNEQTTRLTAWS